MGWASKLQDVFKDSERAPRRRGTRGRARRRPPGFRPHIRSRDFRIGIVVPRPVCTVGGSDPGDADLPRFPDRRVETPDWQRVRGRRNLEIDVDAPSQISLFLAVQDPAAVRRDEEPEPPSGAGFLDCRPRGLGPPGRVADHPIADSGPSTGKVRLDPGIEVPPDLRGPQGGPFDPRPIEALPSDRPSRFGIAHPVSATFSDLRIATAYSSYPADR